VEFLLPNLSSRYVAITFYQTLGELHAHRGDSQSAEGSLRTAIALSERGLRSLHSQKDRLTWVRETSASYRSLVESLFRRGDTEGALEIWEWFRGAALRSREMEDKPGLNTNEWTNVNRSGAAALPALQVVVERSASLTKEAVISYQILSDGIAAWIYDDRGIESKWIPVDRKRFDSLAARFSALCSDPMSDTGALRKDSRQLYDLLVAPFADRLSPQRTLVIEPDGPISAIPFQALTDPHGTYLIDRMAVTWSPGLYVVQATRSNGRIQATQSALIVGATVSSIAEDQDLQLLPNVAAEARNIGANFRHPQILLGGDATPNSVQAALPKAAIFHFAGHALSTADDVKLILNPGASTAADHAFLTASSFDADSLRLAQLAVFSACTTEKTQEGNFAEPTSLVTTFLNAGVPNVVATRWKVDSVSTEEFMTEFYRFLIAGLSVAQASRAASNEIRRNANRAHPFYWSAFNVFGRG
jgi:CHAT domain-containing protein